MKRLISCCILMLSLQACGENQPLYSWGNYPHALLNYYKNPDQGQKFEDSLRANIQAAEAVKKVPPGLYAEYGYMLLEHGNTKEAGIYFAKEKEHWPESSYLMDKLISRIGTAATPSSAAVAQMIGTSAK